MATTFHPGEGFAREQDAADPLRACRDLFHIPPGPDGRPTAYFAGNSLGLQPKRAAELINEELQFWAKRGVEGHFEAPRPWYSYHELLRESGARLVGALPGEVVIMNSLTVNLHLMMTTFFRPTQQRYKILMEDPCFPSDIYAVRTQLRLHGLDPASDLIVVRPRQGDHLLRIEDLEAVIQREGASIALILLAGVNFVTGQLLDLPRITAAGQAAGAIVGFDLAHAAGNVPLALHDWNVDFAVWCNYKYLNSGPGAVGACFVHQRHGKNTDLPRMGGWWGNDPATRFRMHLNPEFIPREGADGWQLSNPPILALAPVLASYEIFDRAGMSALREKSLRLTGYLEYLLEGTEGRRAKGTEREATKRRSDEATKGNETGIERSRERGDGNAEKSRRGGQAPRQNVEIEGNPATALEIITPRDPGQRGCQLSLRFPGGAKEVLQKLHARGIICDHREPDILRVAPVPLYNTFHDVSRFADALASLR